MVSGSGTNIRNGLLVIGALGGVAAVVAIAVVAAAAYWLWSI